MDLSLKLHSDIYRIAKGDLIFRKLVARGRSLEQFVVPIFFEGKNTFRHVGSGILLRIGNQHLIATASHVANEKGEGSLCLPGEKHYFRFPSQFVTTSMPNEDDSDPIDLAFALFDNETSNLLGSKYKWWPIEPVSTEIDDRPRTNFDIYTFIGYPSSKHKPRMSIKVVKPQSYAYSSVGSRHDTYQKYRIDPASHVLIDFDPKASMNQHGNPQTFPKPDGMSGGGVWSFRVIDLPQILKLDVIPKLAGIIIERSRDKRHWIGLRSPFLLEAIRAVYPELSDRIPRSKSCTIEVTPTHY